MGKRSSGFERIPRDFYPTTPFVAVPPLIPHLRGRMNRRAHGPDPVGGAPKFESSDSLSDWMIASS
jgi:hypothetical protein